MDEHEINLIQHLVELAHDSISCGESGQAATIARDLLTAYGANVAVAYNCAGLLIDAGERLDDEPMVAEGTSILEKLFTDEDARATLGEDLIYSLANGRGAPAHMRSRRLTVPTFVVRDLSVEEGAVSLYYAATERLRGGSLEAAINCASMLRLEGRNYEAIDILDTVLQRDPEHPNAHQKMAEILWAAYMACRGRDRLPQGLILAALWHYRKAEAGFRAQGELMQVASNLAAEMRLRELVEAVFRANADDLLNDISPASNLGTGGRLGSPIGLSFLARSPYVDSDDPNLVVNLPSELKELLADAVGTYVMGRHLILLKPSTLSMPRWQESAPSSGDHALYAAVRQLWSVLDKLGWILNRHFQLDLSAEQCYFASIFRPPSKDTRAKWGLSTAKGHVARHPNLERDNSGLLALSGLSLSINNGIYDPIKRLRHAVEHRIPDKPATHDDAAFMLGVIRAAVLHTVDALILDLAAKGALYCE